MKSKKKDFVQSNNLRKENSSVLIGKNIVLYLFLTILYPIDIFWTNTAGVLKSVRLADCVQINR